MAFSCLLRVWEGLPHFVLCAESPSPWLFSISLLSKNFKKPLLACKRLSSQKKNSPPLFFFFFFFFSSLFFSLLLLLLCGEIRECFWGFFVDESNAITRQQLKREENDERFSKRLLNSLLGRRRRPFFCVLSVRKGTEQNGTTLRLLLRWMTTTTGMKWVVRRWRRMRLLTKGTTTGERQTNTFFRTTTTLCLLLKNEDFPQE